MTIPDDANRYGRPVRSVDAGRLWTGGVATALVAALLATGLLHLLLLSTPQPRRFFTWIITLATIAAALAPFLSGADLDEKVATSAITLVVGVAIGSLLSGVARSAVRTGP